MRGLGRGATGKVPVGARKPEVDGNGNVILERQPRDQGAQHRGRERSLFARFATSLLIFVTRGMFVTITFVIIVGWLTLDRIAQRLGITR